jgi:hypothetical protein
MSLYEGLEIIFEERRELIPETEEEINHYCESTIDRACEIRRISCQSTREAMLERLRHIPVPVQKVREKRNRYTFAEQKPPEGYNYTHS